MKYEIRNVPEDLPDGKYPSRILKPFLSEDGELILPVEYAPDKRVEDSAIPIIVNRGQVEK